MRWAVVVPSNRPQRLARFLDDWQSVLRDVKLIVVEDSESGWEGIPPFIPRRTDMIRSWGFYLAWKAGAEYVLSLDDDVLPTGGLLRQYELAFEQEWPLCRYLSVGALTDSGLQMRGFPHGYRAGKPGVQYGGWDGVADFDAITQIGRRPKPGRFHRVVMPVPEGIAVTGCAMNMAFRGDLAPIMWQLPLHDGKYNRFGDIWSGLIVKKVLDRCGMTVLVNGKAVVHHARASDPHQNLVREAPGVGPNEGIWDALPEPESDNPFDGFREVTDGAASHLAGFDAEYAEHFLRCRDDWLALFE